MVHGERDMAEVEVTEEDKLQLIETTGEGKSAVSTPDGKSRKKKKSIGKMARWSYT